MISLGYKSLIAAAFVAVAGFAGTSATAMTLTASGTSCSVASVEGATSCSGIWEGNDSNQDLDGLFGVADWTEILKLDSSSGTETDSGITLTVSANPQTWSVDTYNSNDPVMFVLKGGDSFSAFLMDTTVFSGDWDNESMLKGNGSTGAGLSHWAIYSGGTADELCPDGSTPDPITGCDGGGTGGEVPLPAGLPLMLSVIGVGAYMRKRSRKSA